MTHRRPLLCISAFGSAALLLLSACSGGGGNAMATPGGAGAGNPTATAGARATVVPTSAALTTPATQGTAVQSTLTLTSDAFTDGGTIPVKYSCSGEGTSPALTWSGAPAATKSFTLIVHDPDAPLAGGFTHWIVADLPATAASLPAATAPDATLAGGAMQIVGYRGMCPPVGAAAHHYHFRLYALDETLGAAAGQSKDTVEAAMQAHVLAQTDLVGVFGR